MNYIGGGGGGGGGGRGAAPAASAPDWRAGTGTDPEQAAAARGGRRSGARWTWRWTRRCSACARSGRKPRSVGNGPAGASAGQAAVRTHHRLQHEHGRHRVAGRQRRHLRMDQDTPGAERVEHSREPGAPTKAASSSPRRWHLPDRAAGCSEAAVAADRCSTRTTR